MWLLPPHLHPLLWHWCHNTWLTRGNMQPRTEKENNTLAFETEVKNYCLGHKQGLSFVYSIQSPKSPRSHQHLYVIKIFPARKLMRPWASNRRRLPDKPAVLLFNSFKHTVHSRYIKKKDKATFQLLTNASFTPIQVQSADGKKMHLHLQ